MSAATASRDEQRATDDGAKNTLPVPPSYQVGRIAMGTIMIMIMLLACAMFWWEYSVFVVNRKMPEFDVKPQAIVFLKMVNQRQDRPVWDRRKITCYGDHPVMVSATVGAIGVSPAYSQAPEDAPSLRLTARPVDGRPDEVVEYAARLMPSPAPRASPYGYESLSYVVTAEIPPSFAGRDIVWTATASHPDDRRPGNNTLANLTLPACKE